jgi:transposase
LGCEGNVGLSGFAYGGRQAFLSAAQEVELKAWLSRTQWNSLRNQVSDNFRIHVPAPFRILSETGQRGADFQAIGRSRCGRTTKIYAVVDARGRPVAFEVTLGQRGDAPIAVPLLATLPPSRLCTTDTAYDSKALRCFLIARGSRPVIPNTSIRTHKHPFDPDAYKRRNLIERAFCCLKNFRRVATRYDKLKGNFAAACCLAARSSGGPD